MRHSIRLGFRTDGNGTAFITIPDAPATTPPGALVIDAMEKIIATGILRSSAGVITAPASARHIGVEITDFVI